MTDPYARRMTVPVPGKRLSLFTSGELAVLHRALTAAGRADRADVTTKALLAQVDDELRRRRIDPYTYAATDA